MLERIAVDDELEYVVVVEEGTVASYAMVRASLSD
jgi:hypothetical protein